MPSQYTPESTDEQLRQGCIERQRLAQQYLYQRYYGQLVLIPLRYLSDRAEATAVLNQAFLKIFDSMESYSQSGAFAGWMAKIVLHTTIDHLRSQQLYRRKIKLGKEIVEQPVENEAIGKMKADELLALIQRLPPAARAVFSLYVIDGYKHREIAVMLGIDINTSKWHLMEARRKLQKLIQQQELPDKLSTWNR